MTNKTSDREKERFTGKHFLVWILGFFGVVIAINIAFIFLATDTWTGLSSKTAYVDGLKYNQTLEAAKNQQALGWRNTLVLAKTGQQHSLDFTLADQEGTALSGFTVTALIGRPTLQKYDQTVTLGESTKGMYQAILDLPLPGQWHVSLKAISPSGTSYQLEQRFIVK